MELHVRSVSHSYGRLEVLNEVSLTVNEGETLVVIGPSGCGKSTLLQIMGGLLEPSAGVVETVGDAPDGTLNLFTYIFQDFALLPWRTVAGNIALPLAHHGLTKQARRERVERALDLTGLGEFAQAYPRQLSGGMRQRVGIARAIAVTPAILFLDEPLSSLDAQTRALLLEDLLAIWEREKTTSVYVTHNLDEALRVADRIAVLSRRPGRLKEIVVIDLARAVRARPEYAGRMAEHRAALWRLIRDEAADADREVADV